MSFSVIVYSVYGGIFSNMTLSPFVSVNVYVLSSVDVVIVSLVLCFAVMSFMSAPAANVNSTLNSYVVVSVCALLTTFLQRSVRPYTHSQMVL